MPKEYGRDQRVADFIQRELATVLQSEMRDPRAWPWCRSMRSGCLEIWAMQTSTSHPQAGDEAGQREVVKALAGAAGYLRTALAKRSTLRVTPRLRFHWDSLPGAGALSELIDTALAEDRAREQDREGDA